MVEEAGGAEKRFLENFGNVVRWNGPFGVRLASYRTRRRLVSERSTETIGTRMQEDRLWIADPKAINHILQKSGYLYAKPNHIREGSALVAGHGIVWAEGEFFIVTGPFPQPG